MKPTIRRPAIKRAALKGRAALKRRDIQPVISRPAGREVSVVRKPVSVARKTAAAVARAQVVSPQPQAFAVDPYEDYQVTLTHEGGIAITYRTLDEGFLQAFLRFLFWVAATCAEAWALLAHSPFNVWISCGLLIAGALINYLIVSKPGEIYRQVEVRPDCLILDGNETFMLHKMEGGWPAFKEVEGMFVLSGIYGTRFVEYLKLPRFDENDRAPEVFAAHLQYAMQQLWARPY